MTKISVIIPVYNGKDYLKQCLESIISQTLKGIQIICVDDGSTDCSCRIIEGFIKTYANITLLHAEHKGSGNARNMALKAADGKYVAFMDCDDWYYSQNVLELLYNKAEENRVNICGGCFCEYYQKNNEYKTEFDGALSGYTFHDEGKVNYADYQFDFGFHRFIYNREFLVKEGIVFPDYRRYQDVGFFVKAMYAAKYFYAVPQVVYCYRVIGLPFLKMTPEKWDAQTNAMYDVLLFAKEKDLKKLWELTYSRMVSSVDVMSQILVAEDLQDKIIVSGNCTMENLLNVRYKLIQLYSLSNGDDGLIGSFISSIDEKIENIDYKYYLKYNTLKNSGSFKIGRAITALPRKLKKWKRRR